jgi:hypothetical protein
MIYVEYDEQFHLLQSVQHNSLTMQRTVLDVQQYFTTHYLPRFGPSYSIISEYKKLYKNRCSIYWSIVCTVGGNSLVHNMYSGPNSAQYTVAACCYAGTVHGTGGTVLFKL